MNKKLPILILVTILFAFGSCKSKPEEKKEVKPIETLGGLITKYSDKEFKNCDEFLAFGDEIIDVYIKTVNKAFDGDENAKSDLEDYELFMIKFDNKAEKFALECPDKFEKWATKTDEKVASVTNKLVEIFYNEYEGLQWDEEMEKELDKQVEELNEDLKKVAEEEKKLQLHNLPN